MSHDDLQIWFQLSLWGEPQTTMWHDARIWIIMAESVERAKVHEDDNVVFCPLCVSHNNLWINEAQTRTRFATDLKDGYWSARVLWLRRAGKLNRPDPIQKKSLGYFFALKRSSDDNRTETILQWFSFTCIECKLHQLGGLLASIRPPS